MHEIYRVEEQQQKNVDSPATHLFGSPAAAPPPQRFARASASLCWIQTLLLLYIRVPPCSGRELDRREEEEACLCRVPMVGF